MSLVEIAEKCSCTTKECFIFLTKGQLNPIIYKILLIPWVNHGLFIMIVMGIYLSKIQVKKVINDQYMVKYNNVVCHTLKGENDD